MRKNKVLKIENLTFGYKKDLNIYKNFNLSLSNNELISIVGSSGSGKTTLFELITGELKTQKGNIEVGKIAFIYQDPYSSFHPSYSILEQINDVVDSYTNDELDILLGKLDLQKEYLHTKPHNLSGGQLQRCSILRAVLMKPDIILADEPTSALDNIIALDTMKMLIGFLDSFGILLITHDEDLAKWCSNKIINLDKLKGTQ
jgi:peptide/nickel transport system ATP-binding protein